MKKIATLLMLSIIVLAVSCNKADDPPFLTISESQTLTFGKQAEEKIIEVNAGHSGWAAFASEGNRWITLMRKENALSVKVTENLTTTSRKAMLTVTAGGIVCQVEIMQSGSDAIITLQPEEVLFSHRSTGKKVIEITTNAGQWTAEAAPEAAEWLSVHSFPARSEMVVSVKENGKREPRKGKIIVKAGNKTQQLEITQKGTPYYIMPLLLNANFADIDKFENERNSSLIINKIGFTGGTYVYIPESPIFTAIQYQVITEGKTLTGGGDEKLLTEVIISVKNKDVFEKDDFKTFVREHGFEFDRKETYKDNLRHVYVNKEKKAELYVCPEGYEQYETKPQLYFYIQGDNYPTFSELPIGLIDFNKADKAATRTYEATHGGKENSDLSYKDDWDDILYFDINDGACIGRAYRFSVEEENSGKLIRQMHIFNNTALVGRYVSGNTLLSLEFKELLKKSGFEYLHGDSNALPEYYNAKEKITLQIEIAQYSDLLTWVYGMDLLEEYMVALTFKPEEENE